MLFKYGGRGASRASLPQTEVRVRWGRFGRRPKVTCERFWRRRLLLVSKTSRSGVTVVYFRRFVSALLSLVRANTAG